MKMLIFLKNIYHEIIKEYDSRSLEIIKNNIALIQTLIAKNKIRNP